MQRLVDDDGFRRVDPGTTPDYDTDNSLLRLLGVVETTRLAAAREAYDFGSLEYLFPLTWLELYGPAAGDPDVRDPRQQDDKGDFQKQNVADFHLGDTRAVRGWAVAGGKRVPFLQLSYRAGPDSALARSGQLGAEIGCSVTVSGKGPFALTVPYDEESDRYLVEVWGVAGDQLPPLVDQRGQSALAAGLLLGNPDLAFGSAEDYTRVALNEADVRNGPPSLMHPTLPLYLDVRWSAGTDGTGATDPSDGSTSRLGFEMQLRGWDHYLKVGRSPNPHGGVGTLEYRNLFSQYFTFSDSTELHRVLEPWNLDAFGRKGHTSGDVEPFLALTYMDLHVLEAGSGIGLHRHRDNQEAFLVLDGSGYMVVGDWADSGTRIRSFEVRTLPAGSLALLRGGNLHAFLNASDRRTSLFLFGGYD